MKKQINAMGIVLAICTCVLGADAAVKDDENTIGFAGSLIGVGLSRDEKPEKGWYYSNDSSWQARIDVAQSIGGNRYLCRVVGLHGASVTDLLDVFIVRSKREFVDGEKLQDGIFKYVGTASYQTVMGAEKTVREFVEVEGAQLQAFNARMAEENARMAEEMKRQRIEQEKAEKERQKQAELFNTEAITNVQNFIKSLNVDLDPRNRIRIDKSIREQVKVIVPKNTLDAMDAKQAGDLSRINGTKTLVESYKENRKLTQEAVTIFFNSSFRYLNQEVRLVWPGCGRKSQSITSERQSINNERQSATSKRRFNRIRERANANERKSTTRGMALATFRILPQTEELVVIKTHNFFFSPHDKADSFLRKHSYSIGDDKTRVDDLHEDLTISVDMSFDYTAAMFVFRAYEDSCDKKRELSYGFSQAEAAFNRVAPRYEELKKQLKMEEILKEDFDNRSRELKRELYIALCKASENEGVEKVVTENAEKKANEDKKMAAATATAKKRFAEQLNPCNRIKIDNAITNLVHALVPKDIREGIEALKNGNLEFFAPISNPNYKKDGTLTEEEIKKIDLTIKQLGQEIRIECLHGHPGMIIFKVHMGDGGYMEFNGKKHEYDDFVKYGLVDLKMGLDFDRSYNRMQEFYNHAKLKRVAEDTYLEESVPVDERIFVFGRGTKGFQFAIQAYTRAIAWRKKLQEKRTVSNARDDDSFSEEDYKKKIGELKVQFCGDLEKAVGM